MRAPDFRSKLRGAVYRGDGPAVVALVGDPFLRGDALQLIGDGLAVALALHTQGAADLAIACARALRQRGWDGDDELSDQLGALLGTDPTLLLRPLPVDLEARGTTRGHVIHAWMGSKEPSPTSTWASTRRHRLGLPADRRPRTCRCQRAGTTVSAADAAGPSIDTADGTLTAEWQSIVDGALTDVDRSMLGGLTRAGVPIPEQGYETDQVVPSALAWPAPKFALVEGGPVFLDGWTVRPLDKVNAADVADYFRGRMGV